MMEIFREILAAYGGVHLEDIRGMRAPFLAIGVFIFILIYLDNDDNNADAYDNDDTGNHFTL